MGRDNIYTATLTSFNKHEDCRHQCTIVLFIVGSEASPQASLPAHSAIGLGVSGRVYFALCILKVLPGETLADVFSPCLQHGILVANQEVELRSTFLA